MKTTIDIPDDVLRECMSHSGAGTIRGAVVTALVWFNNRERQRSLIKHLGTLDNFMTAEELAEIRQERGRRHDARRQQLVDRGASSKRKTRGKAAGLRAA